MRVHIISCVFPPEPVMSATTSKDIAQEMARRGHEVTVFGSFPNRPIGEIFEGYRRQWKAVEQHNGYRIVRCWHTISKSHGLVSQLAQNISFGISSTRQVLKTPSPDVVYMNTWPLLAQWMNTYPLSRRGVPVICSVKDLYPESFFSDKQGILKKVVASLALAVDKRIYRQSSLVTPLNPIMGEYIASSRSIDPEKVRVLYDWVDASQFPRDQSKHNAFRETHNLSAKQFVAMYVGSMTRMAGLQVYVEAAEHLRHREDIMILLVGDGAMREGLERDIQAKGLNNIRVLYPLAPDQVPGVQAAADVLMLSLVPGGAEYALPAKLIYYLFSQRPVIASVEPGGPPARVIEDANCGHIVEQGSGRSLADRLVAMADDTTALDQLGDNARSFAEEHFLKENALRRVCDSIEEVATRKTH